MSLSQLLKPDAVLAALRVNGKKQALQEMSERAALVSGLPAREIFDALLQRERLGSTGVGDGVAIPHGKLAKCQRIFGVFARLERPIDFEAPDGLPVDLIFLLIAPEAAGRRPPQGAGGERAPAAQRRRRRPVARDPRPRRRFMRFSPWRRPRTPPDRPGSLRPMKARVIVTLKSGVLDPQGKAIEGALKGARHRRRSEACARARFSTSRSTAPTRGRGARRLERGLRAPARQHDRRELRDRNRVSGRCARR